MKSYPCNKAYKKKVLLELFIKEQTLSNNDYTDYKIRLVYSDTVDKANYTVSPTGKLGGQGDYLEKENYLYRIGETHPLMVHVREQHKFAEIIKNTNYLLLDTED